MNQGSPEPIAALNRVRILENHERLVDIREFCPRVIVREEACPYLRHTVAEMLNRAAESLPKSYRFKVATALRTLSMQRKGWDRAFRRNQREHPDWPLSALKRATNRFHAPYDQPAPPGHCTGGAVDVLLLGPSGRQVDVTSPGKRWETAATWHPGLTDAAKRNRMVMVEAMLGAGFSNCRDEFWHYSWGDSAWAVRVGEKTCPYGWIDPTIAVESGFRGGIAAEIRPIEANQWSVRADANRRLLVGVFWALGKPVVLLMDGIRSEQPLRLSKDRKVWRPLSVVSDGDALAVSIIPRYDRVYIESAVSR